MAPDPPPAEDHSTPFWRFPVTVLYGFSEHACAMLGVPMDRYLPQDQDRCVLEESTSQLRDGWRQARLRGREIGSSVASSAASRLSRASSKLLSPLRPSPPAPPPPAFPQFTHLPAEIRQMIWELAMPGPRAVVLRTPRSKRARPPSRLWILRKANAAVAVVAGVGKGRSRGPPSAQPAAVWKCMSGVPALLHVNAEARAVALCRYRLCLAVARGEPTVYLDLERDYVGFALTQRCVEQWVRTPDMARVRNFVVASPGGGDDTSCLRLWQFFKSAKEVVAVSHGIWRNGRLDNEAVEDFPAWRYAQREAHGGRNILTGRISRIDYWW